MNSLVFLLPLALVIFAPSVTQGQITCKTGMILQANGTFMNGTFVNATCAAATGFSCLRYDVNGSLNGLSAYGYGGLCIDTASCQLANCGTVGSIISANTPYFSSIVISHCGINCCETDICNDSPAMQSYVGVTAAAAGPDGNMKNTLMMLLLSFTSLVTAYWMK